MTPPNDMPADTELRKAINNIMFDKMGNQGWNGSTTALVYIEAIDELMQLIKARDAAIRQETMQDMAYIVNTVISDYQALGYQVDVIGMINDYVSDHTPTDQKEKAENE